MADYREHLVMAEKEMQLFYDKAVMTLSGGALALSFTFLKDVHVASQNLIFRDWLVASWVSWALSIGCILASFFTSTLALRRAIHQNDANELMKETVGGKAAYVTQWLNVIAGVLFLIGLFSQIVFICFNRP
jgi:hypothetical protein